jgi:hypothetical protein
LILKKILRGCVSVPEHVKEAAMESQELELCHPDGGTCRLRTGQLMGNLLSFPLLCIVNYLAFRYYTGLGRDANVKINGDDIVFQSSRQVADRWMEGVVGSGLVLSRGKTMVDRRYFSLNSRLFLAHGNKPPALVSSIRSTAFGFGRPDDPVTGLPGRWRRVLKDYPCSKRVRLILENWFLRVNVKYVVASRRSLTRGLDCLFSPSAISRNNLWSREVFYLSQERETPLPMRPSVLDQQRVPEGWELRRVEVVTKELRDIGRGAGPRFVECAWGAAQMTARERYEKYEELKLAAPRYVARRHLSVVKRARLLKVSPRNAKRYLRPSILRDGTVLTDPYRIIRSYRPAGKKLWLPAESCSRQNEVECEYDDYVHRVLPVAVSNVTVRERSGRLARVQFVDSDVYMEPPPSYASIRYQECRPPASLTGGSYMKAGLPSYSRARLDQSQLYTI